MKNELLFDPLVIVSGNLEDPDTSRLGELERQFAALEEELNATSIDAEIEELKSQNEKINCWRDKYQRELSDFKKDVDNIMEIRDSLPDDCFKTIDIESPLNG